MIKIDLIKKLGELGNANGFILGTTIALVVTLGISSITYLLIEKSGIKFGNKFINGEFNAINLVNSLIYRIKNFVSLVDRSEISFFNGKKLRIYSVPLIPLLTQIVYLYACAIAFALRASFNL
jgi:hypothetical protein